MWDKSVCVLMFAGGKEKAPLLLNAMHSMKQKASQKITSR